MTVARESSPESAQSEPLANTEGLEIDELKLEGLIELISEMLALEFIREDDQVDGGHDSVDSNSGPARPGQSGASDAV